MLELLAASLVLIIFVLLKDKINNNFGMVDPENVKQISLHVLFVILFLIVLTNHH